MQTPTTAPSPKPQLAPGRQAAGPWAWPGWSIALICVVLALGFIGMRGIWDPDEGRYTNVALNMLDSGDWTNPMRNEHTGHLYCNLYILKLSNCLIIKKPSLPKAFLLPCSLVQLFNLYLFLYENKAFIKKDIYYWAGGF